MVDGEEGEKTSFSAHMNRVLERPDDDGPRLIFADWLDDRTHPLGPFIRVQCALARLAPSDPTRRKLEQDERAMLLMNEKAWLRELSQLGVTRVECRRGFPEAVDMDIPNFLQHAGELFAMVPVRSLRIDGRLPLTSINRHPTPDHLKQLAACPYLANLTSLDLLYNHIGPEGVETLAASPHLANLTTLNLQDNDIGDRGMQALANTTHIKNLTTLKLSFNRISDQGVRALANSPDTARLTKLNLMGNDISDDGAEALADSPNLEKLTTLNLRFNNIGDRGVQALADSPHLKNLDSTSELRGYHTSRRVMRGMEKILSTRQIAEGR
jgi:uncharacterized protein (TIGR02996 family)